MVDAKPAVSGVFVEAGSDGRPHLLVSRCSCGAVAFPPRGRCAACGQPVAGIEEAAAMGNVYSWTTQPGTQPPRVVALVKLDGGVTVQGFIEGESSEIAIDQRVRTVVVPFGGDDGGELTSYAFEPVAGGMQ